MLSFPWRESVGRAVIMDELVKVSIDIVVDGDPSLLYGRNMGFPPVIVS